MTNSIIFSYQSEFKYQTNALKMPYFKLNYSLFHTEITYLGHLILLYISFCILLSFLCEKYKLNCVNQGICNLHIMPIQLCSQLIMSYEKAL